FNGGMQASAWKTLDGKLLFAGVRGIVEVNPDELHENLLPPPVIIEGVNMNGQPVQNGASIPVDHGHVEFQFAALSFVAPEKAQYKFKLEGFEKDWVTAHKKHEAFYTNLPPGDYQFRVIATNNDGVWNDRGASFSLSLTPHFYQTRWF